MKKFVYIAYLSLFLSACAPIPFVKKPAPLVKTIPLTLFELTQQLPLGHRVKKGEYLQAIAKKYQQSIAQLIRWNQLQSPYQIYQGQILQVSGAGGARAILLKYDQQASLQQISSLKPAFKRRMQAHVWQWPSRGQSERTHSQTGRRGLNIYGSYQQAIYASAAGKVLYSGIGPTGYEGHLLIIRHSNACVSVYAHNQTTVLISGMQVQAGSKIASMGYNNQGKASLHFEISCANKTLDPLSLLPRL